MNKVERFYKKLFTTSRPTNFDSILNLIPPSVDNSVNDMLISEVMDDEINKSSDFSLSITKLQCEIRKFYKKK